MFTYYNMVTVMCWYHFYDTEGTQVTAFNILIRQLTDTENITFICKTYTNRAETTDKSENKIKIDALHLAKQLEPNLK